jgi:hypothetical protein
MFLAIIMPAIAPPAAMAARLLGLGGERKRYGRAPCARFCARVAATTMSGFFTGWGFTLFSVLGITVVFFAGYAALRREFAWVRALTDYLGSDLATPDDAAPHTRGLTHQEVRDEATAILEASDPAWADKQVRGWSMRAQRLEPALGFWSELLRQLGLLGTVLGLGISLAVAPDSVEQLLGPLGLAVWTTVAGLVFSIWLSAQFGMKMAVWADTCEKNISAWDARRRRKREAAS